MTTGKSSKGLRNLYDQVESHVRALNTAGVTSEHYGALLIPIIVERLPEDIRLQISRKLGTKNWKINDFMQTLKTEIAARESCEFMRSQMQEEHPAGRERHTTAEALYSGAKVLVCAFCGKTTFMISAAS